MRRCYAGWSVLPALHGSAQPPVSGELGSPKVARLKSVRVLRRETPADDSVVRTAEFEEENSTNTTTLLMKKFGNDWRLSGHL